MLVLSVALDIVGFITAPTPTCALWKKAKYLLPFVAILLVLVNGSHGLGFTCKFALVALMLTDCIVSMTLCHDPELDAWFI